MTQEQERLLIRKYATAFLTSQIIHAYNEFAQKAYTFCNLILKHILPFVNTLFKNYINFFVIL